MNAGFLCNSMCFLRYYVPIIQELNCYSDTKSTLFIHKRDKYDEPRRHLRSLDVLGEKYNFTTRGTSEIPNRKQDFFFTMEGELADFANSPVYSMTYQTDFRFSYPRYADKIHTLIAPSKFLTEHYGVHAPRVKYFEPTKYSAQLNDHVRIVDKYNITEPIGKFVLLIFPRLRDLKKNLVLDIINKLEKEGFYVIIKTRGKDKVDSVFDNNGQRKVFEDFSWYPHSTLELLKISKFVINFDSTAIEECLFMKRPVINFSCKTHRKRGLDFLYQEETFCRDKKDQKLTTEDIYWAEYNNADYNRIKQKYFNSENGGIISMVNWLRSNV